MKYRILLNISRMKPPQVRAREDFPSLCLRDFLQPGLYYSDRKDLFLISQFCYMMTQMLKFKRKCLKNIVIEKFLSRVNISASVVLWTSMSREDFQTSPLSST